MVPLFAGVIIAGLGIGALLSAFAARHASTPSTSRSPLVVVHTPTPVASVAQVQSTVRPTVAPTAKPAATKRATTPRPAPSRKAAATEAPKRPVAIATPVRTATPTLQPAAVPTVAPAGEGQNASAESLVRRYLEAVAHGDDAGAHAALGGSGSLDESQFLDPSMRITSISASRGANGSTNVQAEMRTARGDYFGTFVVDPSGTRITDHVVIPVGGTTAR